MRNAKTALTAALLALTAAACVAPPPPANPPTGRFEVAYGTADSLIVRGWAADPDTKAPIDIHLYAGPYGTADAKLTFNRVIKADNPRPDVEKSHPTRGPRHGYTAKFNAKPGRYRLCAYAINVGPSAANTKIGCVNAEVNGTGGYTRTKYKLYPTNATIIFKEDLAPAQGDITRAAAALAEATGRTYTVAGYSEDRATLLGTVIEVRQVTKSRCEGDGVVGCAVAYINSNGDLTKGIIELTDWAATADARYGILLHEFAHLAGLDHHFEPYLGESQIMGNWNGARYQYSQGDRNGLRILAAEGELR